jgi:hypothetical protein
MSNRHGVNRRLRIAADSTGVTRSDSANHGESKRSPGTMPVMINLLHFGKHL